MDIENIISVDKTIVRLDQIIDGQARKYPDKIAIKHGLKTFDYKSVSDISSRISLYFKDHNIKRGDVIGIAADRSPELIVLLLALVKAGVAYLPIDINLPINRINYMLNDSGAKFLIGPKDFCNENKPGLNTLFIEDAWEKYANYDIDNYEFETDPDSIAYILYTSGSTGKPKGVQVKHSGLLNLLLSIQLSPGCNADDLVLATTTISFDIAELEIYLPLISGACVVLANAETAKDGRLLIEIAKKENITIMQGTPTMWRNMLESGWNDVLPIKVFCGGEAMARDLAKKLVSNAKEVWNMYGPTETTIYSTIKRVTAEDKIITIGKPILNTQVYILDEQQNEVANGETGEIFIGGTGVALGYINKPELTAQKFIDSKFSTSKEKIYKTGDLGRILPNGEIECLGRIDHQIKIRGYRIETEEIEYQLKQITHIKNALVVLFKDYLAHMHLVAYVVAENKINDTDLNTQITVWKAELKKALPEYMIPDIFKVLPVIPLLPNGKVDRNSLPDPVIGEGASSKFVAPQTDTEKLLTEICLKNIALDKIGITDNFFELGMDSMTAVQIMVQIEQQFCKRIPLSALIQNPTIKEFASFLDKKTSGPSYKSLVPIKPKGDKVPLYIVHGIGLNILNLYDVVQNMDENQPVYGMQALGLDGTTDPLDNMEAIARFYNNEIIDHNPTGPYAIAGYSFGGYIAFEMARQLKAMGKKVVLLAMLDTNIQQRGNEFSVAKKIGIKVSRQFHKIAFRAQTIFKLPELTAEYLKIYYNQKLNMFLADAGVKKEYNPDNLPAFMLDIIGKLFVAFKNYRLKSLDVQIELFKAETRLFYVDDPEFLGWGKFALKGVNVHSVPGDHKVMFSPPNDKILAGKLQHALDLANNQITTLKTN